MLHVDNPELLFFSYCAKTLYLLHIQSQASVHVMSGHFKLDNGHEGFVVSVMGHFPAHVATFTKIILVILVLLYMPDMAATFCDISVFLTPSLNFLLYL